MTGAADVVARYAALRAIVHTEWPECLDLVRSLTDDPHPAVAQLAANVLEAFAQSGLR